MVDWPRRVNGEKKYSYRTEIPAEKVPLPLQALTILILGKRNESKASEARL